MHAIKILVYSFLVFPDILYLFSFFNILTGICAIENALAGLINAL
jgi:hypothetical protein